MSAITGICAVRFETMAEFIRHLSRCVRCTLAASVSLMNERKVEHVATPANLNNPEYHTPPSRPIHYHAADPTVAFDGESCDRCPTYAEAFIAETQGQSDHFLVPAPADYLACDRTINEERRRLRAEYIVLSNNQLIRRLIDSGRDVEEMYGLPRAELIVALVDTICPRGWLDRRLKEVL